MTKTILQLAQLYGQRRWRDMQDLGGASEVTLMSNHPKVSEMVKVQIIHFYRFI
jgi:hypothetical protein